MLISIYLGWYAGEVTTYNEINDDIGVKFESERGVHYNYNVQKEFSSGKVKLRRTASPRISDYRAVTEIGAEVEMYWTEEELGDSGWPVGRNEKNTIVFLFNFF